ncbi:hypothetical protein NPX13_g10857 [Xylaria arbuscula]|uniref:Uncharacterized protein n=1 Tax=Xylaria arbuscula TaxID=114810 RepID=A0A9W8N3R9_9PEZI|nr:hypothetical protein NPX13_g10857 [Xylaria arbuscula]
MPDVRSIQETLNIIRNEVKEAASITSLTLNEMRDDMEHTNAQLQKELQESVKNGNEAKEAAREATEVGRTVTAIVRGIKNNGMQNRTAAMPSYAAMAARGLATSIHNTQNFQVPPKQIQREIIVNIRDPLTVANLRAMNPRSLKAHIDRAIEQSNNEHIVNIKIVSSNQLKSGDLSIKTATTKEMETLRQFTDDWTYRIGNGASVRLPTYGVLVHGIRTNSMDMDKPEDIRNEILLDNKPFIPNADIRYIRWLSRKSLTKPASSIIIEFKNPADANKIIDEGLIWQGQVFQWSQAEPRNRGLLGANPQSGEDTRESTPETYACMAIKRTSPARDPAARGRSESGRYPEERSERSTYNVRKARDTVMATMLRDPKVLDFDILAVQEPWRNPFQATTHHPAEAWNEFYQSWHSIIRSPNEEVFDQRVQEFETKACPLRHAELLAVAGMATTDTAVEAANTATAAASTTISISAEAIAKASANIAAVEAAKAAAEASACTACTSAEVVDSITVIALSSLPSAPSSPLRPYIDAREAWYKAQPRGSIKTNQQYRKAMGLPARYDERSFEWCLDYSQMGKRCANLTGPREWTKEEKMAYLDWDRAENERVEGLYAENPLDPGRGVGDIWRRIEDDNRVQQSLYSRR